MKLIERIKMADYDYPLTEDRIALTPLLHRDQSKMLIYNNGIIKDSTFNQLSKAFDKPVLFVRNNTRVIQARFIFQTKSAARVELFLLEPENDLMENVLKRNVNEMVFKCMVGNKRKWHADEVLHQSIKTENKALDLYVSYISGEGFQHRVKFYWSEGLSVAQMIEKFGLTPLPPYIKRQATDSDRIAYQTVYSDVEGSVAAPTAGLHFTNSLIKQLEQEGHEFCDITLHVGAGTFKPVQVDNAADHQMHGEEIHISYEAIKKINEAVLANKAIVAIGTTSVRSLETLFGWGIQIHLQQIRKPQYFFLSQWEVYSYNLYERKDSIEALIKYFETTGETQINGRTHLMIVPGHEFEMCDAMITNFHQPRSTLLLLVAAFIGADWRKVYDHALQHNYRFLSYGDSSLLWHKPIH
jgi:S-adenosylmethionine:tRNA ribosyltransferase-isomerase